MHASVDDGLPSTKDLNDGIVLKSKNQGIYCGTWISSGLNGNSTCIGCHFRLFKNCHAMKLYRYYQICAHICENAEHPPEIIDIIIDV